MRWRIIWSTNKICEVNCLMFDFEHSLLMLVNMHIVHKCNSCSVRNGLSVDCDCLLIISSLRVLITLSTKRHSFHSSCCWTDSFKFVELLEHFVFCDSDNRLLLSSLVTSLALHSGEETLAPSFDSCDRRNNWLSNTRHRRRIWRLWSHK